MAISSEDVKYLAQLSRIQLQPEELEQLVPQLNQILEFVEKLKEVNTEGVSSSAYVADSPPLIRQDEVKPSLPTEKALANAPDPESPFFRVPKVIEATD